MENQTETYTKEQSPSLVGMFTNPGEQFDRIRNNSKILVPLIIGCILYAIGISLMTLSMDESVLIGLDVPEDQVQIVLGITKVTAAVIGILSPIIGILVSSVIHLIITKIANSQATFKQLFSMNTYIMIIGAVGLTVNMGVSYLIGSNPEIYVTSLAGVLNLEKAGILGNFEIFSLWTTVLTAIGLHKTAQLSKGLAWTIAIVFFLIGIGFAFLGSLLQGATIL